MTKPNTFFRGSELTRLLVLLVILVGGMVLLWQWMYSARMAPPPQAVARAPIAPIVPDTSIEFETVTDRTALGVRDMAAYEKLLANAAGKSSANLARESRHDVLSIQIWEHPEHYRGVPIHLLGTVLRVLTYETKLTRSKRLYEAWMVTSDSQRNPYCCVFEDAPPGFPVGDNLSERIVFNGYFLKLMKYQSGKDLGFYTSPVLIGRIGWAQPDAPRREPIGKPFQWMAIAVAVMFVLSFLRWMSGLKRSLAPLARSAERRPSPIEEISPEALAAWVETVPEREHPPDADDRDAAP